MTVFREVISAIPEAFRSKWSDLPRLVAPQAVVDTSEQLDFDNDMCRLRELRVLISPVLLEAPVSAVEDHLLDWDGQLELYRLCAGSFEWVEPESFAQMWAEA